MKYAFARLFRSRRFWIALIAVVQSVLFALWPNFPQDVWKAIDAVLAVVIATYGLEDAAARLAGTTAVNVQEAKP